MIPSTIKTDQALQQTQGKTVTSVKPVTSVTPVFAETDSKNTAHNFVQGQKYIAQVGKSLPNGNFSVLIADKSFQMHLPEQFKSGDKIELLFISQLPKLKFVLQNGNFTNTETNKAVISTTGQFLNGLFQESDKPNPTISKTAILTNSPLENPELPWLLQKTIQQSGLFYESHLKKWLTGKHTLEELKQEPQANIRTTTSSVTATATSTMPVNSQTLSLIQQQISALETNHIVWNGEIWDGQQIQWELYEENTTENNNEENTPSRWNTKLTMTLPELGKITISLALNSQNVKIAMDTGNNQTAQLLKTNQIYLKKSMQASGLSIQSLDITQQ